MFQTNLDFSLLQKSWTKTLFKQRVYWMLSRRGSPSVRVGWVSSLWRPGEGRSMLALRERARRGRGRGQHNHDHPLPQANVDTTPSLPSDDRRWLATNGWLQPADPPSCSRAYYGGSHVTLVGVGGWLTICEGVKISLWSRPESSSGSPLGQLATR